MPLSLRTQRYPVDYSHFFWWNTTFWFLLGICLGFSLTHGSWGKVFGLENVASFVGVIVESYINH